MIEKFGRATSNEIETSILKSISRDTVPGTVTVRFKFKNDSLIESFDIDANNGDLDKLIIIKALEYLLDLNLEVEYNLPKGKLFIEKESTEVIYYYYVKGTKEKKLTSKSITGKILMEIKEG